MSVFDGCSLVVNPGRSARVEGAHFSFGVERKRPGRVRVTSQNHGVTVSDEQAATMMRALAAVLGYEIGERTEL